MANNLKDYGLIFLFILFIPILNVGSSLATPFFTGSLNPGIIRGVILTIFLLWYILTQNFLNEVTKPTILFISYLGLLCLFSDEPLTSLYIYNKVFITSMMLILGVLSFNSVNKLKLFFRIIVICLMLLVIYFIFSNVTGIGKESYKDESVLFGESGVNMTKAMVIFLLIVPTFLKLESNSRWRIIAVVFCISAIIIVFFGMKRSAILAMLFGLLSYFILTPNKTKLIKYLPFLIVFLLITSTYYLPIIEKRFKTRQERVSMTYNQLQESENEGRVLEIEYTLDEMFEGNGARPFFGFNVFLKKDFNGNKRMLHIDYMNMLGGAGITGLLIFLTIYFKIGQYLWKIKRVLKNNNFISELFALGIALIVVQAFLSIGGTMQGVNLRGYILFILGAILGVMIFHLKNYSKGAQIY